LEETFEGCEVMTKIPIQHYKIPLFPIQLSKNITMKLIEDNYHGDVLKAKCDLPFGEKTYEYSASLNEDMTIHVQVYYYCDGGFMLASGLLFEATSSELISKETFEMLVEEEKYIRAEEQYRFEQNKKEEIAILKIKKEMFE